MLTQGEDLPQAEVARQLGISEEELRRRIANEDAYLRARLGELGVGPGEAGDAVAPQRAAGAARTSLQPLMKSYDALATDPG